MAWLKRGKKTIEWDRCRAKLKIRFAAVHLITCEFRYAGCWKYNGLTFAHIKKRRNLRPEELEIVALACLNCHGILELMKEEQMTKVILAVIKNRICQP